MTHLHDAPHWHRRFLAMAQLVATWSKDPSTRVGAVIVNPNTRAIISTGYNGFPRGIDDTRHRLDTREIKLAMTVHAEVNAILNAARNGSQVDGAWLFCTWPPCQHCAGAIIQAGIARVVYIEHADVERWRESFNLAQALLGEAGIEAVGMTPTADFDDVDDAS